MACACSIRSENATACPSRSASSIHLILTPCTASSMRQLTPSLLFSLFLVEIALTDPETSLFLSRCCGYCGLGNLGETQQSQAVARLPWMPMKMELLLSKVFLEPASPLEKHIFHQKHLLFLPLLSLLVHLFISIPTLLFASSFTSILKF